LNTEQTRNIQKSVNRKNATWGGIEYLSTAISLVVLTPLVIGYLGQSTFGLLIVANTILGLSGIVSLGIGPATLHFVAKYRESGEDSIRQLVETSIITSLVLGLFAGGMVIAFANYLPFWLKTPEDTDSSLLFQIVRMGGAGLPFIFLSSVMDGTLRGFEKFDLAVPLRAVTSLSISIAHVTLVLLGFGIITLVLTTVIFQACRSLVSWLVVKVFVVKDLRKIPSFSLKELKQFFSYGIYIWTSSIFATLQQTGETLILVAIVGPALLTNYAVPTKVLSQTHSLLAKVFSYLFPYATKLISAGKKKEVSELYSSATKKLCFLSAITIPALTVCCGPLLSVWLGEKIANEMLPIFQILAFRYAVYPLSILTYNLLLAAGKTRVMTMVVALNTIFLLPLTAIMAYFWGVQGAAYAQLIVFIPVIFNRYYIEKTLFGFFRFSTVALPVLTIAIPLAFLLLFVRIPVETSLVKAFGVGVSVSLGMCAVCWFTLSSENTPLSNVWSALTK